MAFSGVVYQHNAQDVNVSQAELSHSSSHWENGRELAQPYTRWSLSRRVFRIFEVTLCMALTYIIFTCLSKLLDNQSWISRESFSRRLSSIEEPCPSFIAAELPDIDEESNDASIQEPYLEVRGRSGRYRAGDDASWPLPESRDLLEMRPFYREHSSGKTKLAGRTQLATSAYMVGTGHGTEATRGRLRRFNIEPFGPRLHEQVRGILGQSLIEAYELSMRFDVRRGNSQARIRVVRRLLNAYSGCLSSMDEQSLMITLQDENFRRFSLEWTAAINARLQSWYSMVCAYDEHLVPSVQKVQRKLYTIRKQLNGKIRANPNKVALEKNLRHSLASQSYAVHLVEIAVHYYELRNTALHARDLRNPAVASYVARFGSIGLPFFKALQMPFVFMQCLDELYTTANMMQKHNFPELASRLTADTINILSDELQFSTRYNMVFSAPSFRAAAVFIVSLFDQMLMKQYDEYRASTEGMFHLLLNPHQDVSPSTNALDRLVWESNLFLQEVRSLLRNARIVLSENEGSEALRAIMLQVLRISEARRERISCSLEKFRIPLWPQTPDGRASFQWMRMHSNYLRAQFLAHFYAQRETATEPEEVDPSDEIAEPLVTYESVEARRDAFRDLPVEQLAEERDTNKPTQCTCVKFAPLVLPIRRLPGRWTPWRMNLHADSLRQQIIKLNNGNGPYSIEQRLAWTQKEIQWLLMPEEEPIEMLVFSVAQNIETCESCGGLTISANTLTAPKTGNAAMGDAAALLGSEQEGDREAGRQILADSQWGQGAACGDRCFVRGELSEVPPPQSTSIQDNLETDDVSTKAELWSSVFGRWHAKGTATGTKSKPYESEYSTD